MGAHILRGKLRRAPTGRKRRAAPRRVSRGRGGAVLDGGTPGRAAEAVFHLGVRRAARAHVEDRPSGGPCGGSFAGRRLRGRSRLRTGPPTMTFQDLILTLQKFWADRGCLIVQPYNSEVGAG